MWTYKANNYQKGVKEFHQSLGNSNEKQIEYTDTYIHIYICTHIYAYTHINIYIHKDSNVDFQNSLLRSTTSFFRLMDAQGRKTRETHSA